MFEPPRSNNGCVLSPPVMTTQCWESIDIYVCIDEPSNAIVHGVAILSSYILENDGACEAHAEKMYEDNVIAHCFNEYDGYCDIVCSCEISCEVVITNNKLMHDEKHVAFKNWTGDRSGSKWNLVNYSFGIIISLIIFLIGKFLLIKLHSVRFV